MNRAELLKRITNKPVAVSIDGYGDFKVKGMSTSDYLYAAAHGMDEGSETMNQDRYFAALVTRCALDVKGKRIFTDADLADLTSGKAEFILPLALEIQKVSGALNNEEDVKKA
tara:strand:- start:589 stop:927 length:339 start_codon:yes stop_codon:yes gene_type:complete